MLGAKLLVLDSKAPVSWAQCLPGHVLLFMFRWHDMPHASVRCLNSMLVSYKSTQANVLCILTLQVKQKGGSVEQIVIADMAFDVLKNAWGKFESGELRK